MDSSRKGMTENGQLALEGCGCVILGQDVAMVSNDSRDNFREIKIPNSLLGASLSGDVEMSMIDPLHSIAHQFAAIVELEFLFDVRPV